MIVIIVIIGIIIGIVVIMVYAVAETTPSLRRAEQISSVYSARAGHAANGLSRQMC